MTRTLALLLVIAAPSLFAAEIPNPILTQDLQHTPRLLACMKGLLLPLEVRGFHGPFFGTTHEGKKDRSTVVYIVRGRKLEKYYWYFKSTSEFRMFGYDIPEGTAFGMFGPSMSTETVLAQKPNGVALATPDLSPCAQFIGKP